jgi:hypothetical protein
LALEGHRLLSGVRAQRKAFRSRSHANRHPLTTLRRGVARQISINPDSGDAFAPMQRQDNDRATSVSGTDCPFAALHKAVRFWGSTCRAANSHESVLLTRNRRRLPAPVALEHALTAPPTVCVQPSACTMNCDYTAKMEPHRIKLSGSSGGRWCNPLCDMRRPLPPPPRGKRWKTSRSPTPRTTWRS